MEVILQTKIPNLGNLGEKVRVKNGYARNYLLPKSLAVVATADNIAHFEAQRSELERKEAEAIAAAKARAEKLSGVKLTIAANASDEGKLYGSVGTAEIVDAAKEKDIAIEKREISLPDGPLHSIGEFPIDLHLHSDVVAQITIEVIAAEA